MVPLRLMLIELAVSAMLLSVTDPDATSGIICKHCQIRIPNRLLPYLLHAEGHVIHPPPRMKQIPSAPMFRVIHKESERSFSFF